MKLPIKDKFFKEVKKGKKRFEYRDAHITFVNEKTKEKIQKRVIGAYVMSTSKVPERFKDLFDDTEVIVFELKEENEK